MQSPNLSCINTYIALSVSRGHETVSQLKLKPNPRAQFHSVQGIAYKTASPDTSSPVFD